MNKCGRRKLSCDYFARRHGVHGVFFDENFFLNKFSHGEKGEFGVGTFIPQ